jgi:uncharacterized membrane protein YcaP (DUF421 family)
MKPEDIHLSQWQRILIGEVPGSFYLELGIRAAVVYLLLMFSMRLMGKRMSSQLGRNELAALVSLAAAIGVPLQSPDRGLLPAAVIAFVVIFTERWIASKTYRSQSFEKFSQGNIDMLIKDAVIDLKTLKKVSLTRERLLSQLRALGVKHLGNVERLYMEANGSFTLIESKEPQPGLSIIPIWDTEYYERFQKSEQLMACQLCGFTQKAPFNVKLVCPNCSADKWTEAVES